MVIRSQDPTQKLYNDKVQLPQTIKPNGKPKEFAVDTRANFEKEFTEVLWEEWEEKQ